MIKVTIVNNVTLLCQCHSYTIRMSFPTPLLIPIPLLRYFLLAYLPSLCASTNHTANHMAAILANSIWWPINGYNIVNRFGTNDNVRGAGRVKWERLTTTATNLLSIAALLTTPDFGEASGQLAKHVRRWREPKWEVMRREASEGQQACDAFHDILLSSTVRLPSGTCAGAAGA